MKAIDVRPGNGVKMDGKLWVVVNYEFRNPGNLRSFVNLKFKNIQSGTHVEKRCQPSEDLETVDLDRREMEYLYSDNTGATFMDSETFDQLVIPEDVLGNAMQYLKPNSSATVLCFEGNPVSLDLPSAVELEVTDTPPEIKGATATNQMKDAELETGLKTKVPPFIGNGELVKINTSDGSYISRAKE